MPSGSVASFYVRRLRRALHGVPRLLSFLIASALHAIGHALVALVAARLADEPLASFLVFYGHYGEVSDAALEELLALKDQYLGRLALHFIMAR